MHLGNARTALLGWLSARAQGGALVLRIEDLDPPRVVPGARDEILADLRALGLDWDEGPEAGAHGPYVQSLRQGFYDAAATRLLAQGDAYLCACSRADLVRAASAPHAEEEGPRYPGICRDLSPDVVTAQARARGRHPAVRFRGRDQHVRFDDLVAGACEGAVDDFVLRRADGVFAYQLAVVVDDAAMQITEVVRGDDLLSSTPRQIALYVALARPVPRFAHVPLVLTATGERAAKRNRPTPVRAWLDRGLDPRALVGRLAASANLCAPGDTPWPSELVASFAALGWAALPRQAVILDDSR
jgi:glutamyl-tRNA synthetase